MTESAWEFGNDWPSLRTDYPHLCLIECCIETRRTDWRCVHLALLGFRVTYTRWRGLSAEDVVVGQLEAAVAELASRVNFTADQLAQYIADEEGKEHGA